MVRAADNLKQLDAECSGSGASGPYLTVLTKGTERYVFLWVVSEADELLRRVRSFAANPDLSLVDEDAEFLSRKIRERATGSFDISEATEPTTTDGIHGRDGARRTEGLGWRATLGVLLWLAAFFVSAALQAWSERP